MSDLAGFLKKAWKPALVVGVTAVIGAVMYNAQVEQDKEKAARAAAIAAQEAAKTTSLSEKAAPKAP